MKSLFRRYARVGLALAIVLLLLVAFGGAQTASAGGPVYHLVLPGQTLYSIAAHYGVSVWALQCANGLPNPNYIQAGMRLFIPFGWWGACKPWVPPVVHPPAPHPGPVVCFYRVQWGDTLFSIAWRYHTTVWKIQQANNLWNPNMIYAGMILRIPG